MRIVHLCLCGPFTESFSYQENELVAQHAFQGHDVLVLASIEAYGQDQRPTEIAAGEYRTAEGARLIRLPYAAWAPRRVMQKLRVYSHVYAHLERFAPDVVMFHGLCSWELLTVARYKRHHPHVKFYADCHEDFNNSARTWASKHVLHSLYYKSVYRASLRQIEKVLCITVESIDFARDFYGTPSDVLELFPLGGIVLDDAAYLAARARERAQIGIGDDQVMIVQTGKLDVSKLLPDALAAFSQNPDPRLRFVIVGKVMPEIAAEVNALVAADSRIINLGWQTSARLQDILCAADVYVQPFGQTVSTQRALCCRCVIILQDLPSHRAFFDDNGYLLNETQTLPLAFQWLTENIDQLAAMSRRSAQYARAHLDYRVLADRLCR